MVESECIPVDAPQEAFRRAEGYEAADIDAVGREGREVGLNEGVEGSGGGEGGVEGYEE